MKKFKRILSLLVINCFILSYIPYNTNAQEGINTIFQDLNGHWAKNVIVSFSNAKIINGYSNNTFKPENPIKIVEICTIINRIFKLQRKTDVINNTAKLKDWFYQDIQKAYAAKYLPSIDIHNFNVPATRELAFYILNRVFKLDVVDLSKKDISFIDLDKVSLYAKNAVINLVSLNIIKGYNDNTLRPQKAITRAEFITLLSRMIDMIVDNEQQYQFNNSIKNVVINSPDTTLKDIDIKGNLYITEGVKNGEVTLQNVNVQGILFVEGGGNNSVKLIDSNLKKVIVNNKISDVRLLATGNTTIQEVEVLSNTMLAEENVNGSGFSNVVSLGQDKSIKVTVNANLDNLILNIGISELHIDKGEIKNLVVSQDSDVNKIKIADAVIENLDIGAKTIFETDVKTTIKKVNINQQANNVKIIGKATIEQIINNSENAYINNLEIKKDEVLTK